MTILCPHCDSLMVARVQGTRLLDRFFSLFSLAQFQCQSCRRLFRTRLSEAPDSESPQERRKDPRELIQIPVRFECGEDSGDGIITDLSAHGCALDSKRRLRPGLLLRIHLPAGTENAPHATAAQIATVRSVQGSRAGVKFLAFTPMEKDQLEQTITHTLRKFSNT